MKKILKIASINDVHNFFHLEKTKHPLICVLRIDEVLQNFHIDKLRYSLDLYQVSLKGSCPYTITNYGRNSYDFQGGTLVFSAPGQVLEYKYNKDNSTNDEGWTLLFHRDLIRKSELGKKIDQYSFFSYATNEALHLSAEEQRIITQIIEKIEQEINNNIDAHSHTLMISSIELLLNYTTRFYDRQFYTRTTVNQDVLASFEQLLNDYYKSDDIDKNGIPTVQFCGEILNISPKYLSDLLRKETGKGAQEHIHTFIIDKAKNILLNSNKSISEIAYKLGFEYPQYFSKIFKKRTKMSPSEFRNLN